jgi:hypothetical protein
MWLKCAEILVALRPTFREVQKAFRAKYLKLALEANSGNVTRGAHAVGLTRHSVERALSAVRDRELPDGQAEAVKALAITIFADVNNNYHHALDVFRRAVAEAAVGQAPRRNWHAKSKSAAYSRLRHLQLATLPARPMPRVWRV